MLEEVVLERYLKFMSVDEFSAFGSEGARGIKIQLAVDLAACADKIEPEPLPKPQAHLQEVSELDELEVAGVQPNQEAVAQEILKRILLITSESKRPVCSLSLTTVGCLQVAKNCHAICLCIGQPVPTNGQV